MCELNRRLYMMCALDAVMTPHVQSVSRARDRAHIDVAASGRAGLLLKPRYREGAATCLYSVVYICACRALL